MPRWHASVTSNVIAAAHTKADDHCRIGTLMRKKQRCGHQSESHEGAQPGEHHHARWQVAAYLPHLETRSARTTQARS